MACVIAVMSLLAAGLQHLWGDLGVLVAALCAAWTEVHASAASIAQLVQAGGMTPERANWALVAVLASSSVAKTALAWTSGGHAYALRLGIGLSAMVAGGAAGVWWLG